MNENMPQPVDVEDYMLIKVHLKGKTNNVHMHQ